MNYLNFTIRVNLLDVNFRSDHVLETIVNLYPKYNPAPDAITAIAISKLSLSSLSALNFIDKFQKYLPSDTILGPLLAHILRLKVQKNRNVVATGGSVMPIFTAVNDDAQLIAQVWLMCACVCVGVGGVCV